MSFEFFLAKRFLSGQRLGFFRLVTTAIAIGGTALGVAALLITLAVMDGFQSDIQQKILGTQPQVVVSNAVGGTLANDSVVSDQLSHFDNVAAVAPYMYGQALVEAGSTVTGIMIRGIIPNEEDHVTETGHILTQGTWSSLTENTAVVGEELARTLSIHTGDTISLIVPEAGAQVLNQLPRIRKFKVVGMFRSGMYEYDANLIYLKLQGAQDLLGLQNRITGYGLRLKNVDDYPKTTVQIQNILGIAYWTRSWQDMNKNLFSALKLERTVMFLILTLIILVSSFTIISNLLLLTIEKAREIGILQAIGASPRQIGKIFLFNGLLLGGTGVSLGLLFGVGISALLKKYPLIRLPADVYYIDKLPIKLSLTTIESVGICAFSLVLLSVLYPAWKASQMDPIQAIRQG